MFTIEIPGRAPLAVKHVALDYNGTIAVDGKLPPSVRSRIRALCQSVPVYVLTADTYGTASLQCEDMGVAVRTFPQAGAAVCKERIVRELGEGVVCLGNGFNDIPMFDAAALSIAILEGEGLCAALLPHAHVLARSAEEALDLLCKPDRLRATLRT